MRGRPGHDDRPCVLCQEVRYFSRYYGPEITAAILGITPESLHRHIVRWMPERADWSRPAASAARQDRKTRRRAA